MSVLTVSASAIAHGVHYSVLAVGFLGLAALLGPQVVARRPGHPAAADLTDEHQRRIRDLQRQIATGSLGASTSTVTRPAPPVARPTLRATAGRSVLVPMAVVSSAAAAGVHGAVGPAHFREGTLIGLFFACAALAQILWALALVMRPHRMLLLLAVLGNSAVVTLWLITRTLGLPAGLIPGPEAVGLWDLACVGWEIVVVVTCAQLLRRGISGPEPDLRLPDWSSWPNPARAWALGSAVVLAVLSFSGASA